jgi:septum formation protein
MTVAEIEAYVDSGEATGKAGAYAIQETGDHFVERIEGSFSNVVGLPLELLERMLKEFDRQAQNGK